jgi:hypothetical protein
LRQTAGNWLAEHDDEYRQLPRAQTDVFAISVGWSGEEEKGQQVRKTLEKISCSDVL